MIAICLKFFCSLSYENFLIGQQLHETICTENNQISLTEMIASLLHRNHRPAVLSYYAAKLFVNLCKTQVLSVDHLTVAHDALSTLIHLTSKSLLNKCVYLYLECLETLIYLLNGNSSLHHLAMYNEQFLSQLFVYYFTPTKILDENMDESMIIRIRASTLTLLAVLASHHEDIKKRIAEHESKNNVVISFDRQSEMVCSLFIYDITDLIMKTIDCCRSSQIVLQLSGFRLFHALSRSVPQLRTTFNDTICDILLDAMQSDDLAIVKISSCVISNIVLEFSTCRTVYCVMN
jgi:hypothetical protein